MMRQALAPIIKHATARLVALLVLLILLCISPAPSHSANLAATQVPYRIGNIRYYPIPDAAGYRERGIASWYGKKFHGRATSNGESYNMHGMTAAHKTLPMNTMLLVRNIDNGRKTIVRVNDRGPFIQGRIIDLSYRAAQRLQMVRHGTARVEIIALTDKSTLQKARQGKNVLPDLYHGEYYVQVGSFSSRANALRLQKRFTEAGHTAVIQQRFGAKATYYRVQVYAGNALTGARRVERALLDHGYTGAFLLAR